MVLPTPCRQRPRPRPIHLRQLFKEEVCESDKDNLSRGLDIKADDDTSLPLSSSTDHDHSSFTASTPTTSNSTRHFGQQGQLIESNAKRIKLDPDPKVVDSELKTNELDIILSPKPNELKSSPGSDPDPTSTPEATTSTPRILLKLNKIDIFFRSLGEWYKWLPIEKKTSLTKKILKRKAVSEAFQLHLEKNRIPTNWLEILQNNYGLKLYQRKKNNSPLTGIKELFDGHSCGDADLVNQETRTSFGRTVKAPEVFQVEQSVKKPKSKAQPERLSREDSASENVKTKSGKFVDLSNEPPPIWWIEQYNTGIAFPRELILVSTNDQNILCYDYNIPSDYYSKFCKKDAVGARTEPVPGTKQIKYIHSGDGFKLTKIAKKDNDNDNQAESSKQISKPTSRGHHGGTLRRQCNKFIFLEDDE